ncbi:RNA-directed DNA polymerase, eukaryota [Tanacetum coccineum]
MVIAGLVSNTQSAFVAERQILDGPFILNEVLDWCKRKKKKALFFKVDFAKAYDSVRWDFLLDVLEAFGFGSTWCTWIRGISDFAKASLLVNGSPSDEFHIHRGLKQGDPLSPFLFILVMEALHLSVCKAVDEDVFKGIQPEEFTNFDILAWWKEREIQFPILSAMARDLLTVQASTVASESAFSISGRIISERRSRLTPESVEVCVCLKDYLDGLDRVQHETSLEGPILEDVEETIAREEVDLGISPLNTV